jgi:hypothetical protein
MRPASGAPARTRRRKERKFLLQTAGKTARYPPKTNDCEPSFRLF